MAAIRSVSDISITGATRTNGHIDHEIQDSSRHSRMTYSRVIGALFLAGFLSYGVGGSLVVSVTSAPDFLSTIAANPTILLLGAFLMLLNIPVDIGKAVLIFPILEKHSKRTALAYLATMIFEMVFLTVGVLALLMIAPLSTQVGLDAGVAKALGSLAVQSNAMAYQIGETTLAVGAVFLCVLLFRTRLVPQWLAVAGLIGYVCLAVGGSAEILGVHVGLIGGLPAQVIPGFFFELALPVWLFIKGFQPDAYRGRAEVVLTPTIRPALARP